MNKEIRQILENQKAIMYVMHTNLSGDFTRNLDDTSDLLNPEEKSKELPTEMPEEDEE